MTRASIEWRTPAGRLVVREPELADVRPFASSLARAYNDPKNAPLLGHTAILTETDVLDHYAALLGAGAHPYMLLRDAELAGDGDIRGITGGAGEFAFLIASPDAQGRGLGTRFATMIHVHAFEHLGLDRLYASVIPENLASRRVFEKLGYVVDDSESDYGDDGDLVLRIDRATFVARHAAAIAEIVVR
jgi:RimJ/RimL family protein N-acetyltransferase